MFIRTTAINKLRKLKKRTKIVQGSSSAGKTYGILAILIDTATKNSNLEISVVSETIPHLRRGCIKDFLKLMMWTNRMNESNWNKTLLTYTFANGSYIEFFSADQENKIRGARRDVLYINECNNLHFETYHQLSIRTNKEIWLDYNPSSEFWAHTELMNEPDSDFIIITYKDNEALNEAIIGEIEKAKEKGKTSNYWENWYKVYGLGEIGSLQGSIFEFNQVDGIPTNAEFISYGLDWGFTNDPTSLIEVYRYNGELYVNELIYSTGLTNSDILKKFSELKVDKNKSIVADSAEPKSIEDIYRGGYTSIRGANKGKDSVINSIDTLKQFKLNITKASTNLIKELRSYVWERDKEGKTTNNPIDYNNHAIDALRYVALNKINKGAGNFNYMMGKL